MASSYPGGLDTFTNPDPGDNRSDPDLATLITNLNDAMSAVQSTLGVDPSGSAATVAAALADTGVRDCAAVALSNGWVVTDDDTFFLRRVGCLVQLTLLADKTSATSDTVWTLPDGFKPALHAYAITSSGGDDYAWATLHTDGHVTITRDYMAVAEHGFTAVFLTGDTWPGTLPGVAA